jgi:hypothetical protein
VPADGTSAATEGNGDFGTSPIFGQLSDKPALARVWIVGGAGRKAQYRIQELSVEYLVTSQNFIHSRTLGSASALARACTTQID